MTELEYTIERGMFSSSIRMVRMFSTHEDSGYATAMSIRRFAQEDRRSSSYSMPRDSPHFFRCDLMELKTIIGREVSCDDSPTGFVGSYSVF